MSSNIMKTLEEPIKDIVESLMRVYKVNRQNAYKLIKLCLESLCTLESMEDYIDTCISEGVLDIKNII